MEYRIKFKPTGIVFNLPKEEIARIIKDDHGYNYEVLDKEAAISAEPVNLVTTTYEQVVETEEVRGLDQYTYEELKAFAKENGLKASGSKATLLERCIEYTKQIAEAQECIADEVVKIEE